ncbi:MAG: NAD(P)H-dependent glycerol-3-phosphate dehydrogenase [Succinivibrionaceae bacterium]|nr:NAD(P)H-dependent glycerol-3-phosphate dehydrogenase [Succinivibrionaceae bacterium]
MKYDISVFGSGSYGTALAVALAGKGLKVLLWGFVKSEVEALARDRENRQYLPGVKLPDTLDVTSDIAQAVSGSEVLLVVVPSMFFGSTLESIRPHLTQKHRLVWATKGLEHGTGRLLGAVAQEILGDSIPLAIISGPTFARELAAGLPTVIAVASTRPEFASELSELMRCGSSFRIYTNDDFIGLQIGGAVKNVIAIGAGVSDGLGFGANARTALITRGLVELQRLGLAIGAKKETFMGMSGMGDLVLTCTDNQSRNRRLGLALGRGKTAEEAMAEIGQVAEGYHNTKEVRALAARYGVDMPICDEIYALLFEHKSPKAAAVDLMSRTQKSE